LDRDLGLLEEDLDREASAPAGEPPPVLWLYVDEDTQLPQEGLTPEAPALVFSKAHSIFNMSPVILKDLVPNKDEVEIADDPDWEKYPEVAEALKQAGGDENALALALCPAQGKWAVGIGGAARTRELAAKLGLCLAIARDSDQLNEMALRHPDFGALCSTAGVVKRPSVPPRPSAAKDFGDEGLVGDEEFFSPTAAPQDDGVGPSGGEDRLSEALLPSAHWLTLPAETKFLHEGNLPEVGLAVAFEEALQEKLYKNAPSMLSELLGGDVLGQVSLHHDPDWEVFPEIGEALRVAGAEETYCVALCAMRGKWAVGLGASWKQRESAARLALAAVLAEGTELLDGLMAQYTEFGALCEVVGIAAEPEWKRHKGGKGF